MPTHTMRARLDAPALGRLHPPDTGDGQGNCNLTRQMAAEALVDWLATDPTGSGDSDFLIIGDLNAYDKEDPIRAIKAGSDDTAGTSDDFTDLLFEYQGEEAYSYLFDGRVGYLDYALANQSLASQVTGVTVWHINADEPDILDYDMTYKQDAQDALYKDNAYRASDHDPVILGLDLTRVAAAKDECKKGGWRHLTRRDGSRFRNQGQCIKYVNTGR